MLRVIVLLLAAACLTVTGCEPYSDPSSSSIPDGPAEAWRGTYRGTCLFTCPSYDIHDREMTVSVSCNPAGAELNVQLFLTPDLAAYSPKYSRTGPLVDGTAVHYYIEDEVFVYHAALSHGGGTVGGTLQVANLAGDIVWRADNISARLD